MHASECVMTFMCVPVYMHSMRLSHSVCLCVCDRECVCMFVTHCVFVCIHLCVYVFVGLCVCEFLYAHVYVCKSMVCLRMCVCLCVREREINIERERERVRSSWPSITLSLT